MQQTTNHNFYFLRVQGTYQFWDFLLHCAWSSKILPPIYQVLNLGNAR